MRLYAVYDQSGNIVAAVRLDSTDSSRPRPVAKKGHSAAELEVPQEHTNLGFADICQRFKVDTSGATPSLSRHHDR